jgi:hypothetical protein
MALKNSAALAVALLAVAGSSVALAGPRESVTFTGVNSNGRIGEAANVVLNATFNGSDGGGAYTAQHLTLSGSTTKIFSSHAHAGSAIQVTPPGGQPFIIRPVGQSLTSTTVPVQQFIPAGAFAIPVSSFTTAGNWEFRFFEMSDEGRTTTGTAQGNALDASWDTITFTLDDAPAPTGANPGPGQNYTFTFVDVDGTSTAPATFTFSAPAGDLVPLVRFSMAGTARSVSTTTNTTTNPLNNVRIQLVTPDGSITTAAATPFTNPSGSLSLSSATGSAQASLATPADSGGVWTVRVYPTTNNTGIDSTLTSLTISFLQPDPPAGNTTVPLVDGSFATATTTISPGQVVWYRIDLPVNISAANFNALDIDNETSVLINSGTGTTSPQDTGMALYSTFGATITSDSADGSDSLGQLSYGRGTRAAEPGSGTSPSVAYNGRDGGLNAGTYYLAVTTGSITTSAGFGATGTNSTLTQISGSLVTRFRYLSSAGTPLPTPATEVTLTEGVYGTATAPLAAGGVAWFFFDLPTLTTTGAVEIDTVGSNLTPANDTAIAIYSATNGFLGDSDSNDGPGNLSELVYGTTTTANGRQSPSGLRIDGRDGSATTFATSVTPPGRFYVAVVGGDSVTGTFATDFAVTPPSANSGTAALRVRYWTANAPTGTPDDISTPIGTPDGAGTWVTTTGNLAGTNDIAWFRFVAPASLTGNGALDIDFTGTSLSPDNDTDVGLYNSTGTLVDSDDNDGEGSLSQFSYGAGWRTPTGGDAAAFRGQDGTISTTVTTTGIVPGNTYYLGVGGATAVTHATTWDSSAGTSATNSGPITVRLRTWDASAPIQLPVVNFDLGSEGAWASATAAMAEGQVLWYTFTTPANLQTTGALDIDTEGTNLFPLNDTDMGLYGPTGTLVDSDDNDGSGSLSLLSYGSGNRVPTGDGVRYRGQDGTIGGTGSIAANTQYYLAVAGGTAASHGSNFNTTNAGTNQGSVTTRIRFWSSNAPTDAATVPTAELLTLVPGTTVSDTDSVAIGGVKWYTFNLPSEVSIFTNAALHIQTEGSNTNPTASDTSLGLYRNDGTLRASDLSDGTGSLATLTFGVDDLAAPGDGLALNGRDGQLTPGSYYLAVTPGATTFVNGAFEVNNTSTTQSGDLTTSLLLVENAATPSTTPPTSTDLGTVGSATSPAEAVRTETLNIENANSADWFRLTILNGASPTTNFYLDIDTEGTSPGGTLVSGGLDDTELGMWTSGGFLVAEDGEDGTGFRSRLTFGDNDPIRTIPPTPTGDTQTTPIAGDGRDGTLIAGTYYVSVSTSTTTFGITDFALTLPTTRTATGSRLVNFRTNLPLTARCGPSDIASPGPVPGSDGELTADDIIFFITSFTNSNFAVADIASPGPVAGADGELTADDIILFITRFTSGC